MTTRRRSFDELALERALRAMLAEGGDVAPMHIAERALSEVARTRQARPPLLQLPIVWRRTTVWAAAAVVLAAMALLASGLVVVGPQPSPSPAPMSTSTSTPTSTASDPSAKPSVDPAELLPFEDPDAGLEMLVPRFWAERLIEGFPGLHGFGAGRGFGTHGDPALTISVGAPDGTVTICQGVGHSCKTVVVKSLEELADVLRSGPDRPDMPVPDEIAGELILAGEPGRWKRPGYATPPLPGPFGLNRINGGGCLGCPGALYHAFTIKDGRPIVLSYDFWTIAFGEVPVDDLEAIIESVHLTSGAS